MAAIETHSLSKEFDGVTALSELDLTIEEGEIFGYLGPNGAGKSTTIDLLLDFIRPTAGSASIFGSDVNDDSVAIRQRVGVIPDGYTLFSRLTGRQHVQFAMETKGVADDPMVLLERVGIADAAERRAGGYSKGMGQRLVLAMALVGDPDLLILDEPTTGLDPNGAREMRQIIREEQSRGATVFFSSHILEQVETVCDRVGILDDGRLVTIDSIDSLRKSVGVDSTLSIELAQPVPNGLEPVRTIDGVSGLVVDGTSVLVDVEGPAMTDVLWTLESQGIEILGFSTHEASLEDVFATVTGSNSRPDESQAPVTGPDNWVIR